MTNMGAYLIALMKTSLKPAVRIQNDHWMIFYKTNKILQKHGRQGVWQVSKEILNIPFWNQLSESNIIWQKCSIGDPLPSTLVIIRSDLVEMTTR